VKFDITVRVEVDEFPDKEEKGKEKAKDFLGRLIRGDRIPSNWIEDYEVLSPPAVIEAERNKEVEVGGGSGE